MDNAKTRFHFGGGAGQGLLPVSAFSAYSLLKNCNYFLTAQPTDVHYKGPHMPRVHECAQQSTSSEDISRIPRIDTDKSLLNTSSSFITSSPLFGYPQHIHLLQPEQLSPRSVQVISPPSSIYNSSLKRHRGEKKPIPDEQKDDRYFERRRRNNQAAKKSRDARKVREDQVALRATVLEHENAILRAQLFTVREEASSLRQLLLQKKAFELVSKDTRRFIDHKII